MPLKLYASDDIITKLEDLGDGLGNFRGLRGVIRCDPENGNVRICGIPVEYDPRLDNLDSETPVPNLETCATILPKFHLTKNLEEQNRMTGRTTQMLINAVERAIEDKRPSYVILRAE